MEFQEVQRLIEANAERYKKKHGIVMDREYLLLKLMEEMGELAEALLSSQGKSRMKKLGEETCSPEQHLEDELADVFNILFLIARELRIDPLTALERKVFVKARKYLSESS
ncbi:hypothetical protein HYW18_02750 [Candidatus Uhrbacteria bacterium]|nr:hypothetical protein [Candidatus Uhrbacteria bacterium]